MSACLSSEALRPATLRFNLDAPFCGLSLPAQFFVDSALVGADTFRVHVAPEHLTSRAFTVAPGAHVLGAKLAVGLTPTPWPDTPDTVVIFAPGDTVTRVLPFYCS